MQLWQSAGVRRGIATRRPGAAMTALALACFVAPTATLAQNAYITSQSNDTVTVINTATNTVLGSPIPVGSAPTGVAVTSDGSKVYVTNEGGNGTVSVISTANNTG
jgi:YVTN family beta-propeller protein